MQVDLGCSTSATVCSVHLLADSADATTISAPHALVHSSLVRFPPAERCFSHPLTHSAPELIRFIPEQLSVSKALRFSAHGLRCSNHRLRRAT